MIKTIEKGFFGKYFIDFKDLLVEETKFGKATTFFIMAYDDFYAWAGAIKKGEMEAILSKYEGTFEVYAYFYNNGKVEFLVEYPYDFGKEDIIIEVAGPGVNEMKKIFNLSNDKKVFGLE